MTSIKCMDLFKFYELNDREGAVDFCRDYEGRKSAARKMRLLVDGCGAKRIIERVRLLTFHTN